MNNTLDTIRASSEATIEEDVSYLYGRDPSILAYGQQRFISKESQKNLYSLYEKEESNDGTVSDSVSTQTVKVYLRLKPFPRKIKLTKDQEEAYKIINSTTLLTKMPSLEHNASCLKRSKSSDIVCKKFTFTQTFGTEVTQSDLFDQAIRPQMIDFLAGQNVTVMSYGTTNSGKSYTLQGTASSPGIIPRALEFVFSNISPKITPYYKPINYSDVISLDLEEREMELDIKTNLLTFGSTDKSQYISAYKQMQKLLREESPIKSSHVTDAHYSVWVSFAEIYNEIIYDLLSNDVHTRRPSLKLSTDSHGKAFIKGLKTVCVSSGLEAYQVLMAGQYNLKVAATALNARSSRSHCIFTVTLLKYYNEDSPELVHISTFSFCDLAGSERLKKTLNEGDRLKEAQNINTSLLVLGRCLKSIYETQGSKQKQTLIGPFRESKLTRLFQKALSGNEYIALIVNVNPIPNLYIETQNVLNFSAIAKKIIIEPKKVVRKKLSSRFSKLVSQSMKTATDWDTMDLENIAEIDSDSELDGEMVHREDYEEIMIENEKLKQEIAHLKNSALERDMQIRQELADTYSEIIKKVENDWRNRVKDVEEQQEDHLEYSLNRLEAFYKEKINVLNSRKRMRSDVDNTEDENQKTYKELEDEVAHLTCKIKHMKETTISSLRDQKEREITEKTQISFELSLAKEELQNMKMLLESATKDIKEESDKNYITELKNQLKAEHEKNKQLKIFLNEAKDDYIAITTDGCHMEMKLKEKNELLIEYEDKMMELEQQLETMNACLSEKVKVVETFEDKIDRQNKLIADLEEDVLNLKEKQCLNKNIMHTDKETMTSEMFNYSKKGERKIQLCDQSCQISVSSFDFNYQEKIKELNELKKQFATFEAEAKAHEMELTNKIVELQGIKENAMKEKDTEILSLQKELKELILSKTAFEESRDRENEKQIKIALKTLTTTEEALTQEKEKAKKLLKQNDKLEKDLQVCKDSIETLSSTEEKNRQLQEDIVNLKESNDCLKNEIQQRQSELEKFSKHRDETIKSYECLVNNLQKDIDREMKEKSKLQELLQKHLTSTPNKGESCESNIPLKETDNKIRSFEEEEEEMKEKQSASKKSWKRRQRKNKENYENTSEEESIYSERRRSPRLLKLSPTYTNDGSIIETPSSESKRQTKMQGALKPPDVLSISEKKKTSARKKKLFQQNNESCVNLDPCDIYPPPMPSLLSSNRSLRTRKK